MAKTIGITSQATNAVVKDSPPFTDAKRPVNPTKPKPAEAGVPVIVKKGTNKPVNAAVETIGK